LRKSEEDARGLGKNMSLEEEVRRKLMSGCHERWSEEEVREGGQFLGGQGGGQ
jgi:hypothetical protein